MYASETFNAFSLRTLIFVLKIIILMDIYEEYIRFLQFVIPIYTIFFLQLLNYLHVTMLQKKYNVQ